MTKTLFLDCFCGISGDMAVGALIDVGVEAGYLQSVADSLGLEGVSIKTDKVLKRGIQATQFQVVTDPAVKQPHRHLPHILEIIDCAAMADAAKADAAATFAHIARAEAEVHGLPVDKVHFHEVGAWDSIMDIVLANAALHALEIEQVVCAPLVVGSGTVLCDHGVMPVPAPATALLLEGMPWRAGDVAQELVTPTGAALVKQWAKSFSAMPGMVSRAVGYGAGTRDLPDRANVLRVFVGDAAGDMPALEPVMVLETTIDDMNPELTASLIPDLLRAGALDVCVAAVTGKKGRMAQQVTVLSDGSKAADIARIIFSGSTTLGVRIREEQRWVLAREIREVETAWGRVQVKCGLLGGEINTRSPEFEVCRAVAAAHEISVKKVYESALAAAIKGEFINE